LFAARGRGDTAGGQAFEEVYFEGLSHILLQPEFSTSIQLRPVVEVLEQTHLLNAFLAQGAVDSGIQIIIGQEHRLEPLRGTSAVLTGYGGGDGARGVLGIVGPTRLPYWRAVPMVRFMGNLLDVLVATSARS
jgi:heat-inducible transcriptional repressor